MGIMNLDITPKTYALEARYTNAAGCTDTAKQNIELRRLAAPIATAGTVAVCSGETAAMSVTGTNTFVWYDYNNAKITSAVTNTYTPAVLGENSYPYTVAQYDGTCTSDQRAAISYTVHALPAKPEIISSIGTFKVCSYDPSPAIEVKTPLGTETYYWNTDGTLLSNIANGSTYATTTFNQPYYVVAQNVATGCKTISATQKTEAYPVVTTPSVEPVIVCEGKVATLIATTGSNIKWFDFSNPTVVLTTGKTFTVPTTAPGEYKYYVHQSNGSCFSDKKLVSATIQASPADLTIVPQSEFTICENSTPPTATGVSSQGIVNWVNVDRTITTSNTFTPKTQDLIIGDTRQFTVYAVSQTAGCKGTEQKVSYTVIAKPQKPLVPATNFNSCITEDQNTDTLIAFSANTIEWHNLTSGDIRTGRKYIMNNMTLGTFPFTVYALDGNCISDPFDFTLSVYPPPSPEIIGNDSVCAPSVKNIYTVDSFNIVDVFEWNVISTKNKTMYMLGDTKANLGVDWYNPGIDMVILSQRSTLTGCVSTDTLTVYIAEKPIAAFEPFISGAEGSVEFTNLSQQNPVADGDSTYEVTFNSWWDFGRITDTEDTLINTEAYSPLIQQYEFGTYDVTLRVVNEFGCESSFTHEDMEVQYSNGFYVPNAFAPNGTAYRNRTFKPVGYNLKSYQMWIFDTWGNVLFYTNKLANGVPTEGWDGTAAGELLSTGVYIYKIKATFVNGSKWKGNKSDNLFGSHSEYGSVVLIR